MYPEPQPCVDDPNADLDFYWEVLWNNDGSWSYIGNSEMFTFNNLQEGTHTVKLSITYEGDSANETQLCVNTMIVRFAYGSCCQNHQQFLQCRKILAQLHYLAQMNLDPNQSSF